MAATIVFTRQSDFRVKVMDGAVKVIGSYSIYTNIFEHPQLDAVVLTNDISVVRSMNSDENAAIFLVADVATPSCANKSALAKKLIEDYFS